MLALLILTETGRMVGAPGAVSAPLPRAEVLLPQAPRFAPAPGRIPQEPEGDPGYRSPVWRAQEDPGIKAQILLNDFQGIYCTGWYPPDVQVAAGQTYVGEVVNSSIAFYSKADGSLAYSATLQTFFGPASPCSDFIFDPKIAYDPVEGRWLVLALALNSNTQESEYLLAVSQTSDPLGSWYFYNLDATLDGSTPSGNWADYPGLGFNSWGIFITSNQFPWSSGSSYSKLRVLDKAEIYSGAPTVSWTDFWGLSYSSSWKPAQSMGPADTGYVLRAYEGGSSLLRYWEIYGPASSPSLSPRVDISVSYYDVPPDADQPGGYTDINTGDSRIQDVTYKDGYLYASLTEGYDWGSGQVAALRYFRISVSGPSLIEDITYGSDGVYYYYPRVAASDYCVVMSFSRSSATEYAGAYFTSKLISDPNFQPSQALKLGTSSYEVTDYYGRNRWGDYMGAYMDPGGTTVWVASEYADALDQWGTWIGEVVCDEGVSVSEPPSPTYSAGILVLPRGPYTIYDALGRPLVRLEGPGEFRVELAPGVYRAVGRGASFGFIVR